MARGEGRPDGAVAGGGIMAGIAGIGGGAAGAGAGGSAAAGTKHRALEEAFVVEDGHLVNLRGFVPEDFGVVFDEVRRGGVLLGVLVGSCGLIFSSACVVCRVVFALPDKFLRVCVHVCVCVSSPASTALPCWSMKSYVWVMAASIAHAPAG